MIALIGLGLVALVYAVAAGRLDRWSIGAPIVFVLAGIVLGDLFAASRDLSIDSESVRVVMELTLALLLFADASTIRVQLLERDAALPARLLVIGLPLTIAAGAVCAYLVLPDLGWAAAALVAAILAPTDAALSIAVVSNRLVPIRIRQALNVESGLNDGIATPIVVVLLAAVAADETSNDAWIREAFLAIGIALVVAGVIGYLGGRIVRWADRRSWMTPTSHQMTVLAAALLSYLVADELGGNGFVAAFIAGLLFGQATRHSLRTAIEYTETTGLFLSFAVWGLFGALLAGPLLAGGFPAVTVIYAVLSLTLVRMIPVALALVGTGLMPRTVAFLGWFGPRGLASVVFFTLAVDELGIDPVTNVAGQAVIWTVLLSVVLHGLSAGPLARRYGQNVARAVPAPPEAGDGASPHLRRRSLADPAG